MFIKYDQFNKTREQLDFGKIGRQTTLMFGRALLLMLLLFSATGQIARAADGDLDTAFNPQVVGSDVKSLAVQPNGKIIIFGQFASVNGTTRNRLARINADGTLDATFDNGAGVDGIPFVVVLQPDGKILIGGNFNTVNGTARKNIVQLNSDGSVDTAFNPGTGATGAFSPDVETIAVQTDGQILIGGAFTTFNGTARMSIARLNSNGSLDTSFVPAALNQGGVSSIVVQPDGKIILGGFFTTVNGIIQGRLARFNADGGNDPTFLIGAGLDDYIIFDGGIARQTDGKILIGGNFTSVNGTPRNRVARLNENGTVDTTFNPGTGANNTITRIGTQPNGKILIVGAFTTFNGTAKNRLARLETNGALDTSFNIGAGFDNTISTFALQKDGKLVVSGSFSAYNGTARRILVRISATTAPNRTPFDFDGDGKSDLSIFRPSNGTWYLNRSTAGFAAAQFGLPTDKPAPADYDGDRKTDIAVWREAEGNFYILNSSNNSVRVENLGLTGDKLTVGDWDGDGKADLSVYRDGAQSFFYYRGSLNNPSGNITYLPWGQIGDKPLSGDFDGDGKQDLAVYRGSNQVWYIRNSSNNQAQNVSLGLSTDKFVTADYDGDGKTDPAVWRPSNGVWYILQSSNGQIKYINWGANTDVPVAADYDGDGKADAAIYRNGNWWILRSSDNQSTITSFGLSSDIPIQTSYVP